jgi:hypothetical protein
MKTKSTPVVKFHVALSIITSIRTYFKKDKTATLIAAKGKFNVSRHTIRKVLAAA